MKRYFKGLYMSFGMFCAIPQPVNLWDDKCTNLVLPCFPLTGALIGALWWSAAQILVLCKIHIMLAAAVLTLVPFFASGFLHLDGYMDTSDAVLSRRPIEEKLRILKDPHTGAFAVTALAVLFVLQFTFVYVVFENGKHLTLLIVIPVVSRCFSALSILCLKTISQSSYANMFKQNTAVAHKIFIIFIMLLGFALSFFFAEVFGLIIAASAAAGFILALFFAYKNLKGVSGDVAGFALVISELCGLAAMAITG